MIPFLRRWGFLNPWVWMFVTTSALQVFRGSRLDTIIFVGSTLLVWVSASGLFADRVQGPLHIQRRTIFLISALFAAALMVVPRHTFIHGVIVVAILPLVLRLVWYGDATKKERADARINRSKIAWLFLSLGLTTWEFMANILGQLVNDLHTFPTLSVLIDPFLETSFGQAAFVLLWITTGIGFLGIWRRR
jgi:hypothetical protein